MRSRLLTPVLILAAGALLSGAESALACSCAGGSAEDQFRRAKVALTAKLISTEPVNESKSDFTYAIRAVWKNRRHTFKPGEELVLRTYNEGAACGLPGKVGKRYGLFLYRFRHRWDSNLCSVIGAEQMRHVAHRVNAGNGDGKWAPC